MSTPWLLPCLALALALVLTACANTAPPQQGGGASSSRGVQLNNRGHAVAGEVGLLPLLLQEAASEVLAP